ncbi:hypothetical protein EQG49_12525 [Periweissella cryptocerci]|uniref:Uncharacterized protein n=1 Tax=Periweissella cryptocerci TaxID=2506420 RepID=A0A4P6YWI3_9LACO|nr:hypothetical protein EQG49_12525 [Periweissella cryptocerci]
MKYRTHLQKICRRLYNEEDCSFCCYFSNCPRLGCLWFKQLKQKRFIIKTS